MACAVNFQIEYRLSIIQIITCNDLVMELTSDAPPFQAATPATQARLVAQAKPATTLITTKIPPLPPKDKREVMEPTSDAPPSQAATHAAQARLVAQAKPVATPTTAKVPPLLPKDKHEVMEPTSDAPPSQAATPAAQARLVA
ncbi:uncharacterized protein LOC126705089 [Quercus robur]|uniref:uncharacterized protein LOC126705089 n=1 Tax=Quercus robur TaxID=38942 RepID=UPI002161C54E|nr:uncharacterized protein LOC126705089 [Quercus robur]